MLRAKRGASVRGDCCNCCRRLWRSWVSRGRSWARSLAKEMYCADIAATSSLIGFGVELHARIPPPNQSAPPCPPMAQWPDGPITCRGHRPTFTHYTSQHPPPPPPVNKISIFCRVGGAAFAQPMTAASLTPKIAAKNQNALYRGRKYGSFEVGSCK